MIGAAVRAAALFGFIAYVPLIFFFLFCLAPKGFVVALRHGVRGSRSVGLFRSRGLTKGVRSDCHSLFPFWLLIFPVVRLVFLWFGGAREPKKVP